MNMKQQIKALLDDDQGVSPVIGVILMVAITVILAAVIGTFVLGLGDSLQQAPQAQIGITQGDASGEVDISHNGGDTLQVSDVRVVDSNGNSLVDDGVAAGTWSGDFSVGDAITIANSADSDVPTGGNDLTVRIIHSPSDSILVEQTVEVPT